MYYVSTENLRVAAIYQNLDEDFLSSLDEANATMLREAFKKNIESCISFETLPEDFDWSHISRYSIDENHNIIDNGLDESLREPTNVELLLETAGDHEYRLCLLELGVTEDDLQTV